MEQARLDGQAEAHPSPCTERGPVELLRTMRHDLGDEARASLPVALRAGEPLKDVGDVGPSGGGCGGRRLPLTRCAIVSSVLANAGIDLDTIGKQLGTRRRRLLRYAHLSAGMQRKASESSQSW